MMYFNHNCENIINNELDFVGYLYIMNNNNNLHHNTILCVMLYFTFMNNNNLCFTNNF